MNKNHFLLSAFLVALMSSLLACSDDNKPNERTNIPLSEFHLPFGCEWSRHMSEGETGERKNFFFINSVSDLQPHISCNVKDEPYSMDIDFDTNSFFLTYGYIEDKEVTAVSTKLEKTGEKSYLFTLTAYVNDKGRRGWETAVVSPKIETDATIHFVVETIPDDDYRGEIPVTDYSKPVNCQWQLPISPEQGGYVVINNYNELNMYLACPPGTNTEEHLMFPDIGINFEDYSILVATGLVSNGIDSFTGKLEKTGEKEYVFTVSIIKNDSEVMGIWYQSVFIPKPEEDAEIKLVVEENSPGK